MDTNENKLKSCHEVKRVRREIDAQMENEPISDIIKVYKSGRSRKRSN